MNIKTRVLSETKIMLKTKKTIREIAKLSCVSKSTVHNDLTNKLLKIDKTLYFNIKEILDYHKKIRHINGGLSTKIKHQNLKKSQNIV